MYLLHIMSLYAIVRRTQLSKLFPQIVDSLRFIYRKYMIMFLRMNMIYTEEKSDFMAESFRRLREGKTYRSMTLFCLNMSIWNMI